MMEIYTNEVDENGKPIKHTQVPESAKRLIEILVEKNFEAMCVNSGIPRDLEERQSFFHWLKNFRRYGNKLISICLVMGTGGFVTLLVFLTRMYLNSKGN